MQAFVGEEGLDVPALSCNLVTSPSTLTRPELSSYTICAVQLLSLGCHSGQPCAMLVMHGHPNTRRANSSCLLFIKETVVT